MMQTSYLPKTLRDRADILICPACSGDLDVKEKVLVCLGCAAVYPVRNRKIYFEEPPQHETVSAGVKEWLKRKSGTLYSIAVRIFAPVYPFCARKLITKYIDPTSKTVVDLGCGTRRIHPNFITVDMFDYDNVDIVCNLDRLPFRNESIDAFTSFAVLEHVEDAHRVVCNIERMTRAGGLGIHLVPFLYPFHESPCDYLRWTHMGVLKMFKNWEPVRVFNPTGPVSLFLLNSIEFLSILLSFGKGKFKELIYLATSILLFPLKFLDFFFTERDSFLSLSPTLCIVVRKPENRK